MRKMMLASLLVAVGVAAAPAMAADADAGAKSFKAKCSACHDVAAGVNKIGPSLAGIVGRKAASVDGFGYSPAMKGAGVTWDAATIGKYLENPKDMVPGNKMVLAPIKDAAEIANIVAFLATAK